MNLILKVASVKNFPQKADNSVHSYFCEVFYETDEEFGEFAKILFISTNTMFVNDEPSSTPVFSPCLTAVRVEFLGLVVVESVLAPVVNIKAVFKQRADC